MSSQEFLTGNQTIVQAALAAKAKVMFGYPITPTTEIMTEWTKLAEKNQADDLKFLQTEDEMAAGFALIGAVLGGEKAFTATSGPGNILMQDPMSMAEAMRLPTVTIIMARGGPSTGSVIYSQQELVLTTHGGNGEGMRIVYAPSTLQELYDLTIKAFDTAWRYRFPTFILGDGYLAKMQGVVETWQIAEKNFSLSNPMPYLGTRKNLQKISTFLHPLSYRAEDSILNLRNCYNLEEEIHNINLFIQESFRAIENKIIEYQTVNCQKTKKIVIAYGIVAAAIEQAFREKKEKKWGLFKPLTLSPFPRQALLSFLKNKKKILILESSLGQFSDLIKNQIYGSKIKIQEVQKPALGFTPDEITKLLS